MSKPRAALCEQLEQRALLSASPTITTDLAAIKAAKANLATQRATEIATVRADVAAIPTAITNISVSIHREESLLTAQINDDLNKIAFDEHLGPQTLAADNAAINKETVQLRLAEAQNNTAAASADALTLAADEKKFTSDQASAAQRLADDKQSLATTKASEGAKVRATATVAVQAVQAAKAKLIADQQQSIAVIDAAQQQLAAAMQKLRTDVQAGA